LSPKGALAENRQFETITQLWIARRSLQTEAMRANGDEKYITGNASDKKNSKVLKPPTLWESFISLISIWSLKITLVYGFELLI
jgi:glucuronate isomerase